VRKIPKPVPLILDLWSLGHSASDIAARVGLPNGKHVTRIVHDARLIGDPRAVLHMHPRTERLIGRPGRTGIIARRRSKIDGIEVVPAIDTRMKCDDCGSARAADDNHGARLMMSLLQRG
jgi:hypothetical protein